MLGRKSLPLSYMQIKFFLSISINTIRFQDNQKDVGGWKSGEIWLGLLYHFVQNYNYDNMKQYIGASKQIYTMAPLSSKLLKKELLRWGTHSGASTCALVS